MKSIDRRHLLLTRSIVFTGLCSLSLHISCNDRVFAEFTVVNNSHRRIDSFSIEPNGNLTGKFIILEPNVTIQYKADMTGSAKTDGSYQLSYKLNSSTFQRHFGYYSNGYPSEGVTKIDIQSDTVIITYNTGDSYK